MVENKNKQLASRFINSTSRNIFLTGKAGTGKTTFLKEIVKQTHKKVIIAAPTGIAAINAGGVTLHSLFQMPFASFVPANNGLANMRINTEIKTPHSLIRGVKFFEAKRKLLRELELLIIDEVSMLRADILDAINTILQHIRRKRHLPFGGVQILFIGDLLQLPPVVKNAEWEILQNFYPSMFFFNAKVLQNNPPLYIELEHIYRQSDPRFIAILNKLRDNKLDDSTIAFLNNYVKSGFDPENSKGYVFLTTHNYKADNINNRAINKISKSEFVYDAIVEGDFNEKLYPLDYNLRLKIGAQVMFVKNDHTGDQRYYNGKIGTVESLREKHIEISFSDGTPSTKVDRYTWENKKYSVNPQNNEIEEQLTGTFSHYPIKLAWAITVHKSQGLTFEKAVIDVSSAFAPGQIYVALSRLTGLEGLVLSEALPRNPPEQDNQLSQFAASKPSQNDLLESLKKDSQLFIRQELLRTYDFADLSDAVNRHLQSYSKDELRSAKQSFRPWAAGLHTDMKALKEIADRFLKQLTAMLNSGNAIAVQQRVKKAGTYFKPELKKLSQCVLDQMVTINGLKGVKKYTKELQDLESIFFGRIQLLHKMDVLIKAMIENTEPTRKNTTDPNLQKERDEMLGDDAKSILNKSKKRSKNKKGGEPDHDHPEKGQRGYSAELSYKLFKEGKTVEEIAKIRNLAESTIMSHMVQNVEYGKLEVGHFLDKQKMQQILAASKAVDSTRLTEIMAVLGDEFTYTDIRMALAAIKKIDN